LILRAGRGIRAGSAGPGRFLFPAQSPRSPPGRCGAASAPMHRRGSPCV
jgi:hypothetical protein